MSKFFNASPNNFSWLKGLRAVDLGCGSPYGEKILPWLCRLLDAGKAQVIGIDINANNEKFETHAINLLQPGKLDILKPESADLIIMTKVLRVMPSLGSPSGNFEAIVDIDGRQFSFIAVSALLVKSSHELATTRRTESGIICSMGEEIVAQGRRILVDGGVMALEGSVFRKNGAEMNFAGYF